MNRYLLNFSYIGTTFRGIQRQIIKSEQTKPDTSTVQGCIELALKNIQPLNKPNLILSSRTDKGVHALSNYGHVDLEKLDGRPFTGEKITNALNKVFVANDIQIRIIRTIHVPDTFHSRYNAKLRTYLYRIAIRNRNQNHNIEEEKNIHYSAYIPIEDATKCYYLQRPVDMEVLIRNAKLFKGRHDFRTFMTTSKNNDNQKHPMFCLRTITDININRGIPPINSYEYNKAIENYDYWEIKISGISFLYKQVRRIIGSLIAAGSGNISSKDIYEMITIPSRFSWNSKAVVAPPHALYLCEVHYDETNFIFAHNVHENLNKFEQNEPSGANIEKEKGIASN